MTAAPAANRLLLLNRKEVLNHFLSNQGLSLYEKEANLSTPHLKKKFLIVTSVTENFGRVVVRVVAGP